MLLRFAFFSLLSLTAFGQGTRADYERAMSLAKRTDGKVLLRSVKPQWLPDGDSFFYKVETGNGAWEFVFVDCVKGTRTPALDHAATACRGPGPSG